MDLYVVLEGQRIRCTDKEEIFGAADAWFEKNKKRLARKHPGKCVCVDTKSLAYAVGDNADRAMDQQYGPVGLDGRSFLSAYLPRV